VITSVLGSAILAVCALLLVTGIVGMVWVAAVWLGSLFQDLYLDLTHGKAHLARPRHKEELQRTAGGQEVLPTPSSSLSTEAMWHEMQGTSKRSRGRRRPG
jgi:hypothetical protein